MDTSDLTIKLHSPKQGRGTIAQCIELGLVESVAGPVPTK